ncbi:MAG: hypothetical protein AAF515_16780 [Pseudomonadota bacterium]
MNYYDALAARAANNQSLTGDLSQLQEEVAQSITRERATLESALAKAEALRGQLHPITEALVPDASDHLARANRAIGTRLQDLENASLALKAFRRRHGRVAPPRTPFALKTTLNCTLAVLVESVVNAGFFLSAHLTAGPVGALLASTLISATNVFVSASAGYRIGRWTCWGETAPDGDKEPFRGTRRKAKTLLVGFIGVMGGFHLTVGSIRAQESLTEIVHSPGAYLDVITQPESLFLVMAGVGMSVFAYYKGVSGFDDPYPCYGDLARQVEDAEDALAETHEDAAEEIRDYYEDAIEGSSDTLTAHRHHYEAYNAAVNECVTAQQRLSRSVHTAETHLRSEVQQLLSLYDGAPGDIEAAMSRAELDAFCALGAGLTYTLPTQIPYPDQSAQHNAAAGARDKTLAAVAALLPAPQTDNPNRRSHHA